MPHPKPVRCMILITGHPRSGTASAAAMFRQAGLDIRHEEVGKDGTSSWMMAVKAEKYPYGFDHYRRQDIRFKTIIHIVRQPIAAIASIAHTEQLTEAFRGQYVTLFGNHTERAVLSYIGWNKLIHAQLPDITCKTESLTSVVRLLTGAEVPAMILNTREHPSMTKESVFSSLSGSIQYELEKFIDWYNTLK